jgi:hypothetical protein
MANMKKAAVSGKTVKTTTYSLLNPFKKDVKMVNERTTRKPAVKRPGAKPAPLGTPPERTRRGTPAPLGTPPAKPKGRRPANPKPAQKRPGLKPATKGPSAVEAIQRRTSPAGVKKAEKDAKKATKKKYPGLYKK